MTTAIQQATVFCAETGETLAFGDDSRLSTDAYYSPDGATFYQLSSRGAFGSSHGYTLRFDDPHNQVTGELKHDGDRVEYQGLVFEAVTTPFVEMRSRIVPLPTDEHRHTEYVCASDDGTMIYVSAGAYDLGYSSFKFYIGNDGVLNQLPIQRIDRYWNGQTYIITTREIFMSPPNQGSGPWGQPTMWGSQLMGRMEPTQYRIVETLNGKVGILERK